jgi:hypothetical protein
MVVILAHCAVRWYTVIGCKMMLPLWFYATWLGMILLGLLGVLVALVILFLREPTWSY